MATASPRPPAAPPSGATHRSAVEALQDFVASSCAAYEPPLACAHPAVQLCAAPPPLHEESSHEHALGFLFADEMKVVRQLQANREQGRDLFIKLYFARGCASAIPPAPPSAADASEVAKQLRYYGGVHDVLQPQVAKLRMLCDYCTQTVGILSDTIQRIAAQENTHRVIPDVLLDSIIDVMDVVLQMNQLHDRKSSLRNDFSLFKRAFNHVKGDISEPESVAKEIQRLQEFVGGTAQSKNAIWDSLRHNLTSVKRFSQVIFLLVKQCIGHLESGCCLQPQEKFKYIRILPCLMAVLNADPIDGSLSSFQSAEKKLIEATGKIVNRYPVVPVFADLCVKPMAPVLELNLKSKGDTNHVADRHTDAAYDLASTIQQARRDAAEFIPRLLFAINKIRRGSVQSTDEALPASVARLTIEGVRYLSHWRTSMSLFLAAKYQRPRSDDQLEHLGVPLDSPFIEYQRVITHNFDRNECEAVAAIIHIIKTVAQVLLQHAIRIKALVHSYLYTFVQHFVQHTLVPIMHRADKKKHTSLKTFQELRLMCGDWIREDFPAEDFKKRRRERQLPELKRRIVAPSRSQLQMLRTAVNAIYAKRTSADIDPKASIFSFHRQLKSADVEKLHGFYAHSADFGVLLEFEDFVRDLCSFPEMLFRELFLEITKSPQLPVDNSLPWIVLSRSTVEGHTDFDMAAVLSLLETYDDGMNFVLARSEQVAVCNEVAAEAKLFFDHLIYLIGNYAFTAAKSEIARSFLGSDCVDGLHDHTHNSSTASSFEMVRNLRRIAEARQLKFLYESHDVQALVSGHLNIRFMRDMRACVSRLSRPDATLYVAAADLIEVLKRAHGLLSRHFILDSFEAAWEEATKKTRATFLQIKEGDGADEERRRLQRMTSIAITQDLAIKFAFNERTQRFYRTPLPLELRSYVAKTRVIQMDCPPTSKRNASSSSKKLLDGVGLERDCRVGFELMHQPYRSFVGLEHLKSMASLLSTADVVQLVDDCLDLVMTQIEEVVHLFIPVLGAAIPPYRLPRLLYRTEGCYGYFESKFCHMMESKELEAHVFHCLRIIGNALLAIHYFDQVAMSSDVSSSSESRSMNLFPHSLHRLYAFLADTNLTSQWGAEASSNPEQVDKNPSILFLVWNALEFLSCCSPRHGAMSCYRETYGEGVAFAGCTLLHLLGQRRHYEVWNPSQHVLDAQRSDNIKNATKAAVQRATKGKSQAPELLPTSPGSAQAVGTLDPEMIANTKHFVIQATQMRQTAHHFFALLENAWSVPSSTQSNFRADFAAPT